MTREDQIKKAAEIIAYGCSDELKVALIQDFPELAESKDEKIRKFLIKLVNDGLTSFPDSLTRSDVLTYLEKQKEPENVSATTMAPSCWEVEQKEQRPAEWREEDERIFQHCLVILHDYGYDDWFKSICSQPKQEWDEECKKKIVELKTFISMSKGFNKENRQKAFDMIDSLRPSWKPSEEQMEALEECGECKRCIKELYEQLNSRN